MFLCNIFPRCPQDHLDNSYLIMCCRFSGNQNVSTRGGHDLFSAAFWRGATASRCRSTVCIFVLQACLQLPS